MSRADTVIFSWVHLSDIHFGHGVAQQRWDQRLVLQNLKDDVASAKARGVPQPDAILVTGDIAFSGGCRILPPDTISREYEGAEAWLGAMAYDLGLGPDRIFLVPGNHDVQRDVTARDRNVRRMLDGLRTGGESIDEALASPADRRMLESRMANYLAFASRFAPACRADKDATGTASAELFWVDALETSSVLRIRIIGLNTALLSADDNDRGHLRVGMEQLGRTLHAQPNVEQLVLVLSHHPFDWLADEQDVAGWVRRHGHVHLCGHVHESQSELHSGGSGRGFLRLVAGAAHAESGETVGHGYSQAAIVRRHDKLLLRVWPRAWSARNKDFRVDAENVPDGSFFAEHELPIRLQEPQSAVSTSQTIRVPVTIAAAEERAGRPSSTTRYLDSTPPAPSNHLTVRFTPRASQPDTGDFHSDSPPTSPAWIGREIELLHLRQSGVQVAVISGIGGQGKSTLAARHIESAVQDGSYEFWDWRDCREVGDTLQTQLIRLVERLSEGRVLGRDIGGESVAAIVALLFGQLDSRRIVFVFDNIDHYVDIEARRPVLGMRSLMEAALQERHNSQFVFTSRPAIVYDHPAFVHLPLAGLTHIETERLFEARGVTFTSANTRRSVLEAQELTHGHPFWLTLIATQVAKKRATIEGLLADIRQGRQLERSVLPATTLHSIWKTLNDEQRDLLRHMAELTRPETEQQLGLYVEKQIAFNRYTRALRALRLLDLVVTRESPEKKQTLELHPLVREFVRTNFPKQERVKVIARIMKAVGGMMARFRPNIAGASFSMLEHWMVHAELAINAADHREALQTLHEVEAPLLSRGYFEEYVRVAARLFSEFDWVSTDLNDYPHLDSVIDTLSDVLSDLARYDEADLLAARYEDSMVGKPARYINLCSIRSYSYWCRGDYVKAKIWGQRGVDFKRSTDVDTQFESEHSLALARRDSGEVDGALAYFLRTNTLDEVLASVAAAKGLDGASFGNVGRCLWKMGNLDGALICYRHSAQLLEQMTDSKVLINRGWARLWIGEALERKGDLYLAYCFFCSASLLWRNVSPPKAQLALERADRVSASYPDVVARATADNLHVEDVCRGWIQETP